MSDPIRCGSAEPPGWVETIPIENVETTTEGESFASWWLVERTLSYESADPGRIPGSGTNRTWRSVGEGLIRVDPPNDQSAFTLPSQSAFKIGAYKSLKSCTSLPSSQKIRGPETGPLLSCRWYALEFDCVLGCAASPALP